jgi:hypothetical protein
LARFRQYFSRRPLVQLPLSERGFILLETGAAAAGPEKNRAPRGALLRLARSTRQTRPTYFEVELVEAAASVFGFLLL